MKHLRTPALLTVLSIGLQVLAQSPCGATNLLSSGASPTSGQDGIFFNIAAQTDVTVDCFETYFTSNSFDRTNVYIWYRNGSHIGFETNPAQWTLIDSILSFTIPSIQSTLWHIPIAVNVPIAQGDIASFYISNGDTTGMANTGIRYDTGSGSPGATQASDVNITIQTGAGSYNRWVIYSGSRLFAGRVNYSTATSTGVLDAVAGSAPVLFPNPVEDQLTIDLGDATTTTKISIVNGLGNQCAVQRSVAAGLIKTDVSTLAPGVYYVQLVSDGSRSVHRFVKE